MKRYLIAIACFVLGQVGYWALEWRERLEGEPIKAGGTESDD